MLWEVLEQSEKTNVFANINQYYHLLLSYSMLFGLYAAAQIIIQYSYVSPLVRVR